MVQMEVPTRPVRAIKSKANIFAGGGGGSSMSQVTVKIVQR